MTIFLDRSVRPYSGDFAEFNRYSTDPAYRAAVDASREQERRAAMDRWSEKFDRSHPLRSAEQIEEITAMRRIKAAQGGGIVSKGMLK